jgi:hypothetical protein
MEDAKDPRSYAGYRLITDQFWLGKAYVALAFSTKTTAPQRAEQCSQARSWFQLCFPQFESLKDAQGGDQGSERADEIRCGLKQCAASEK